MMATEDEQLAQVLAFSLRFEQEAAEARAAAAAAAGAAGATYVTGLVAGLGDRAVLQQDAACGRVRGAGAGVGEVVQVCVATATDYYVRAALKLGGGGGGLKGGCSPA